MSCFHEYGQELAVILLCYLNIGLKINAKLKVMNAKKYAIKTFITAKKKCQNFTRMAILIDFLTACRDINFD